MLNNISEEYQLIAKCKKFNIQFRKMEIISGEDIADQVKNLFIYQILNN